MTIFGCNLLLSGGTLTGILQDGTLINTSATVSPPSVLILQNSSFGAPQLTCPADVTAPATSTSGAVVAYPSPSVSNACGSVMVACTPASGSTFPIGTTTVTCTATDRLGNTGKCTFPVTVVPGADLSISNDAEPDTAGGALTYRLTVSNAGPFTATGVTVTDPLPGGTLFLSAARAADVGSLGTPPMKTNGAVIRTVGDLASGQSAKLKITVKVTAAGGSTLTNTATVTSSTADPNPGNNSATVQTPVR
jgi:uncharacterized repeat protein (TIGR01451 family)